MAAQDAPVFYKLAHEQPNPKQMDFLTSTVRHVAYGGARGGGKSWAMRRKFEMLALQYPGLKLLLLRRTFPELNENHILPLRSDLLGLAKYNADERAFTFPNNSRIKLGYCDNDADVFQYQGQEYDVIGLEEATQFSSFQRDFLMTCNRTTRSDFTPRMYYTANPGGVGHTWFKRLFVDRKYKNKEKPEDYIFIQANVYDNKVLMESNPEYVENLENLPDELRKAHLEGRWDVFVGQYFTEYDPKVHEIKPFPIPKTWRRYFTMDYGLDMLAGYWIAMDEHGHAYVYREVYKSQLRVGRAAEEIIKAEDGDVVYDRLAPPDLFA
jgi:phage terminase large subunit